MLKLADAAGGIPDEEEIEMLKRKAAREEAAEKEQLAIAALASAGTASNGGGSGGGAATASGGGRNGDKLPDSFHSAISDSGDEGDSSAANEYRAVNSLFEELSGLDGSIDERTDSLMYPLRGGELPKVTEPAEDVAVAGNDAAIGSSDATTLTQPSESSGSRDGDSGGGGGGGGGSKAAPTDFHAGISHWVNNEATPGEISLFYRVKQSLSRVGLAATQTSLDAVQPKPGVHQIMECAREGGRFGSCDIA